MRAAVEWLTNAVMVIRGQPGTARPPLRRRGPGDDDGAARLCHEHKSSQYDMLSAVPALCFENTWQLEEAGRFWASQMQPAQQTRPHAVRSRNLKMRCGDITVAISTPAASAISMVTLW